MYSTSDQKLSVVQLLLWVVTLIPAPSTTQAFNVPAFNACIQVWITYVHLSFLPVSSATCGYSTAATVSQCWTSTRPPEWCASLGQGDTGSRWGPHQLNLLWQSPGELVHSSVSNVLSSTGSISLYITEPPYTTNLTSLWDAWHLLSKYFPPGVWHYLFCARVWAAMVKWSQ